MTLTTKSDPASRKIPISELAKALEVLGEEGKFRVVARLMACEETKNPPRKIQLSRVEEVLQNLFGEGSQILLSIIKTKQE